MKNGGNIVHFTVSFSLLEKLYYLLNVIETTVNYASV